MEEREVEKLGLLDEIGSRVGCMYLSDLHQPAWLPRVRQVLQSISPERYSLWQWNDAVSYISGKACAFTQISEAVQYLQDFQPEENRMKKENKSNT